MTETKDGTGAGLVEFLDWAGRTGEINPSTAKLMQQAVSRVMEIETDPGAVDVRQGDMDVLFGRFHMLNRLKLSSSSMETYRSRFKSSIAMYLAYLAGEPWKPRAKPTKANNGAKPTKKATRNTKVTMKASPPDEMVSHSPGSGRSSSLASPGGGELSLVSSYPSDRAAALVSYDMPLRPDLIVRLTLPVGLTQADAQRIANFVRSLAFAPEVGGERGQEATSDGGT